MKTTVFVHIWNGIVSQVEAVGDGEIEVIVLNQDENAEEPMEDEGADFDFNTAGQERKDSFLKEINVKIEKILAEDKEKFDELETEEEEISK